MLGLSRYSGERILIGTDIIVEISRIKGNKVFLRIEAPKGMTILREEIVESGPRKPVNSRQEE